MSFKGLFWYSTSFAEATFWPLPCKLLYFPVSHSILAEANAVFPTFPCGSFLELSWKFRGSIAFVAIPSLLCFMSVVKKTEITARGRVFFNTSYVNYSTITFFMQLARKLFQDFVQLPRKLRADLAWVSRKRGSMPWKISCAIAVCPAALKTTLTTLRQAALKLICCMGRPCCWSILLHRACIFTGCTEFALLRNITS